MDPANKNLESCRQQIDSIDAQLIELLSARAQCAIDIGHLKGLSDSPFFTPEREQQIFSALKERNPGPLQTKQLVAIYREIISAARAAEKPLRVSYWGPQGTFTNMAAIQTFGTSTEFLAKDTIGDVFLAVEHGEADYGVVPVENSTAGIVPETLDTFPLTNVKICAESYVNINHHLVSNATDLDMIKRVYAGPQPSQQCRLWLKTNLHHAEIVDTIPTAKAAQRAMEDPEGAAIANSLAATLIGIPMLAEHIEDQPHNRTRFLVIGYNEPKKTGKDKTSLMFNLRNRPGELYRTLGAFEKYDVNLMMIESRPAQRASFEYIFYLDCSGHLSDDNLQSAISAVRESALETTVLGSYPAME
ncbi:MAG: prephenate dehydratase [Armatimonadetes bacterium]|nr:prephenate dehydratase [Armatimonadota bacterium]